ncbi:MAG TPA: serine/threonine-protein kinase, partial [Polyangiaceae bacterium]|nr:serine/threonine-protein kinase [Polyangiaceae bacterium]
IVHRDLKPENIFLVQGDDHEVAKVLDFGIAKLDQYSLRDKTTKTGSFMGTPYYMSPEQARGKNIDWRSDLWALGVIVFQCLTGKPPFESEALGDLMGMILYDPIPKLLDRDSSLPAELETFWQRAVNRDRELRFQSAKELADALADTAHIERREIPTMPPRATMSSIVDAEHPSLPPLGRGAYDNLRPAPKLSDASENDVETGAPVSRTRRSALPTLSELTPLQRKLALVSGVAALALIGFGAAMVFSGSSNVGVPAASDATDAPVSEPAPPPVPVVAPRLAEAPPSPLPPLEAAPSAMPSTAKPAGPDRELDEEQKKKDKRRRLGPAAPNGAARNPDYGI